MKTVLMLHYGDNGIRGSEVCFIDSVKALREAGYRAIVVRNQPAMDTFIQADAFAIETLQYPELMLDGLKSELPIFRYLKSFNSLRKIIARWQPDIIYANSGLPCQLAVPAGRAAKVPVLCHFHHPAIKRAYYLWLVKFADAVFFPSQYTRDHSLHKAGVDGRVVHNGVDTQTFKPLPVRDSALRSQLGLTADSIVVGQVGALVPHKRPQLLLKTFSSIASEMPQLHLCLVGKGPLENSLREQVIALGLTGRVTVTGFVDSVLDYYQRVIDINVLASVEEGLGISVIEGSATALPALIANGTGLRETVVPGETGYAFEPDDEVELARLLKLLAGDAALRQRLGAAGRDMVCHNFAIENYRAGVVDTIERTLQSYPH